VVATHRVAHFWLWLLAIVLLGLAVRTGYLVGWKRDAEPCAFIAPKQLCGDGWVYHQSANLLADGKGFIQPYRYITANQVQASAEHPPLYFLYLTGFSVIGLRSVLDHQLASTLLGLTTIVFVALLLREIAGDVTALVGATLAAIYAEIWVNDSLVMSETMAIAITAAFLWVVFRFWRTPTWRWALAAGLLAGAAGLTRAELILYLPFIGLVAVLRAVDGWRARLSLGAVMTAACLGLVAPWVGRLRTRPTSPSTRSCTATALSTTSRRTSGACRSWSPLGSPANGVCSGSVPR
jgi:hypothetical protein